ncbi:hypothetical protein TCA2_4589 [Paenibacillus sp. TCA20]|uniref:Uncharacterized protein n=1 Tax=Paenibacillus urinalis TaxID=521520 RepID=A0ABY7XGW7_9BACL|nr:MULTISPECIES: hypothetical protein [Paenibacillus]WDI05077.1 hypothetical protein PUW25_26265 [Paenibacillus urinalis]GAK42097.1 hypothetical protein TCA2_4589 [Paenibacillus sp. TCA20]
MDKNVVAKKVVDRISLIEVETGKVILEVDADDNSEEIKGLIEKYTFDFTIAHKNVVDQLANALIILKKMPQDHDTRRMMDSVKDAIQIADSIFIDHYRSSHPQYEKEIK